MRLLRARPESNEFESCIAIMGMTGLPHLRIDCFSICATLELCARSVWEAWHHHVEVSDGLVQTSCFQHDELVPTD